MFASAARERKLGDARREPCTAQFKLWAPTAQRYFAYGARAWPTAKNAMIFDAATGSGARPQQPQPRQCAAMTMMVTTANDTRAESTTGTRGGSVHCAASGVSPATWSPTLLINLARTREARLCRRSGSPSLMPGWRRHASAPDRVRAERQHVGVQAACATSPSTMPACRRHRGKYWPLPTRAALACSTLASLAAAWADRRTCCRCSTLSSCPRRLPCRPCCMGRSGQPTQQAAVMRGRTTCFNWGYDPYHYSAPEGSYATDAADGAPHPSRVPPDGAWRFAPRRPARKPAWIGLQPHRRCSQQKASSVLDRIVPGYYHRVNARGDIERSTLR